MINGIVFDSKKEAHRYLELVDLERRNKIQNLELQKTYKINVNGKHICKYSADFDYDVVVSGNAKHVTVDVKSAITKKNSTYRLKNKLFKAIFGYDITEK